MQCTFASTERNSDIVKKHFLTWRTPLRTWSVQHREPHTIREAHLSSTHSEKKVTLHSTLGRVVIFDARYSSPSTPNSDKIHPKLSSDSSMIPQILLILFLNSSIVLQKHRIILHILLILPEVQAKFFLNSTLIYL